MKKIIKNLRNIDIVSGGDLECANGSTQDRITGRNSPYGIPESLLERGNNQLKSWDRAGEL